MVDENFAIWMDDLSVWNELVVDENFAIWMDEPRICSFKSGIIVYLKSYLEIILFLWLLNNIYKFLTFLKIS